MFNDELKFEEAIINLLFTKGWEQNVLKNKTEQDLIRNWADILFENNRQRDRLGDYPLTDGEMAQIIEQITYLKTPLKLNGFINGKTISIKRDNPDDVNHFGKEISLKIYDRQEIAAGQSRYQIAEQPIFNKKHQLGHNRRGDFVLLINGMPLIHVELKKSGIPVSQACYQIEKYAKEGIFSGLFSLVQVFVAMTPEETVYFANPGPEGKFNKDYYFHWADFNNEPINDWQRIASTLLCIPMAHQLIGFYTVADNTDGILKVMRSYQYYAANKISDKVSKTIWTDRNIYGGYIWHTTGSGKTMTSFKSAQLIANSKDADKVVFLMDRIELGTQSLLEYRGFADDAEEVQATENTYVLLSKLKSNNPADTLIVTSIQKMSRIEEDEGFNLKDIEKINEKRIVFIIDEAHRSTFGDMLQTIKRTFPGAIFFGFTGTPIHEENSKKDSTTADVFGDELHRYSIADGIRDKNVLGFDPYQVNTFKDTDVRNAVALQKAKSNSLAEVQSDDKKKEIYFKYMDSSQVPMAGYKNDTGTYIKGIEDYLSHAQYETEEHQKMVVKDILDNWFRISKFGKFHSIFATSSIKEACQYYKLLKGQSSCGYKLKIACLFDPSIDNVGGAYEKELSLLEILTDYNELYGQNFALPTFALYKKDIAARLAHKKPYLFLEKNKEIDILIVVDQMLTGFDSKWINTLYLDKLLKFENIVQAFSRTNRLFKENEKPFGTVRYYRFPYTMTRNINQAFKSYSGDKPFGIFVNKLKANLLKINELFEEIKDLFKDNGINDFEKNPTSPEEKAQFAKLFRDLNKYIDSAKIQGFNWNEDLYSFKDEEQKTVKVLLTEIIYNTLLQRYKELFTSEGTGPGSDDCSFDLDGNITEIDTGKIDYDYMNNRFTKYIKLLQIDGSDKNIVEEALNALHKSFALLSQEEQKIANMIINDIQSGDLFVEEDKSFRDYINEYKEKAKDSQIHRFAIKIGINENKLKEFMSTKHTEDNINEYGKLDELIDTVDLAIAKEYFETVDGKKVPIYRVKPRVYTLVREFILKGGFEI